MDALGWAMNMCDLGGQWRFILSRVADGNRLDVAWKVHLGFRKRSVGQGVGQHNMG